MTVNSQTKELNYVPWSTGDVVKSGVFLMVTALGISVAAFTFARGLSIPKDLQVLVGLSITTAFDISLLAAVWLFGLRKYDRKWRGLGFVGFPNLPSILLTAATVIAAILLASLYSTAVQVLGIGLLDPPGIPPSLLQDGRVLIALVGLAIFLAPISEEAFFRGFVFQALAKRWSTAAAAGFSGILFGLAHLQPGLILPTVGLGILLAYLFQRSGNLWSSVVAHSGFNALSLSAAL